MELFAELFAELFMEALMVFDRALLTEVLWFATVEPPGLWLRATLIDAAEVGIRPRLA